MNPRDSLLPKGAPNPIVWCERCQKHHRKYTFTQEDYDRIIQEGAKKLADEIDRRAAEDVYREVYGASGLDEEAPKP